MRVHDHGSVELEYHTPHPDLAVVNAARVSFDRESDTLTDADERLIRYLAQHGHTSPFRHAFLTFRIRAPLMVARQWWKYVVGSDHTMDAWNEVSRRYVKDSIEFYLPDEWRAAPDGSIKQGSGGVLERSGVISEAVRTYYSDCMIRYQWLLDEGVAPEQARLVLPANAQYTSWIWSASVQSVAHFLSQRISEDAQSEIRDYALAVEELASAVAPVSLRELRASHGKAPV